MKTLFTQLVRRVLTGLTLLSLGATLVYASTTRNAALEGLDLVGEARMQVLFWNIYDARLYAPDGNFDADASFALSLTYLRDLQGEKIAERSVQEMRKQGFSDERTLARWYEELALMIPDVGDGNEIVGVADAEGSTQFYFDGELIGAFDEPEFTKAFFAIWLDERTSEPQFRAQLLGGAS